MRTSFLFSLSLTVATFATGCAAESSDNADSSAADITSMTADQAKTLSDVLTKANAPSNQAPMTTGVGSHIARISLGTAQGGMAHFISQSGSVSTVDGDDLGSLADLGIAWAPVRDALLADGAKFTTIPGANGGSSSSLVATVECKQVISPSAKPTCSVTSIEMTEQDNSALMTALVNAKAPNTALTGVSDLAGELSLTTSQGGMAHFISQSLELTSTDGKQLADMASVGVEWKALETALLDAGLSWKTTDGDHGATSSTLSASVSCHRVIAPQAKAVCTVAAR